jgi:hypothetical protein
MSTELIGHLQAELARLKAENEKLTAENTRRRDARKKYESDLDELRGKLDAEAAARAKAEKQLASLPTDDAKDKRIAELESQIKADRFRTRVEKVASAFVRDDAMADLHTLHGLTPDEAEALDDNALGERFSALVQSKPYLAKPEPAVSGSRGADVSGKPIAPQPTPAPGATRGIPNTSAPGAAKGDPELGRMADYLQQTGRSSNPYRVF